MHRLNFKALMLVSAMLLTPLVSPLVMAKGVYQSGPDFIAQTFAPETPKPGVLWLTAEIRQQAQNILDRPVAGLRVRYHMAGNKTAWILEEIGKEMPITIGIVIHQDKIEQIKILAYRESRGGEVRYPAYTAQYRGASLTQDMKLNQNIDGITGATLSMWAVNKVATLALYYHSQTKKTD